jgi:hypothetical protein
MIQFAGDMILQDSGRVRHDALGLSSPLVELKWTEISPALLSKGVVVVTTKLPVLAAYKNDDVKLRLSPRVIGIFAFLGGLGIA